MSQSTKTNIISGYVKVLPSSKDESSDTEDDDVDDDDDAWLDFAEMSAVADGAQFIRCSKPKEQRVTLATVDNKSQYLFVGRLVLFDPWWLVTSAYVKKGNTFFGRGFPTYDLRRDPVVCRHRLVQQFLTDSTRVGEDNDPMVEELLNFIQQSGDDDHFTFDMLEDKMKQFSQGDKSKMEYISSLVWKSLKGKIVRFAMLFPTLFKMASKVLPYYLLKLVTSDYKEDKFTQLDEAAVGSPWVLGFKQILSREYGVTGMEASIPMFETSGVIRDIPPIERDALYIYNALKLDARQKGHTYFPLRKLKYSERYFKNYVVRNWKKALEYLEEKYVIKIELDGRYQNIFLYANWKAEQDVAAGFQRLLVQGTKDPPLWNVDFSSSDFDEIRKDGDQWLATHLVCNSPITVLSGKGGCGKTTVVTKTLEHVCKNSESLEDLVSIEQQLSQSDANYTEDDDNINTGLIITGLDVATQTTMDENDEPRSLSDTILGSQILLTAPTGKAANLLGHKANLKSCTLHSVIMSFKMHCIEQQKRKKKLMEPSVWTHSNKKVLVVDECSLVSVGTFSTVLNILLSKCELTKIVLLGDIRQLPSIEPGNFLTDIFQLFQCIRFGLELRTNHRAESQLIVENATRISNRQCPQFDSLRMFHLLIPDVDDDHCRDVVVRKLLKESPALKDHVTSQFVSFRKRDCEAINEICCKHYNYHNVKNHKNRLIFRVGDKVCMTKNGSVTNHINRLPAKKQEAEPNSTLPTPAESQQSSNCHSTGQNIDSKSNVCSGQELASRAMETRASVIEAGSTKTDSGSTGKGAGSSVKEAGSSKDSGCTSRKPVQSREYVFGDAVKTDGAQLEDKACQTANMGNAEVKLSNGEVYFITDDVEEDIHEKKHRFITLSDKDKDRERIVCAKFYDLRKECKMKHAWARTIHTYQGSESNTVVYVLGNCGFQTWQHVYTAVTRGRKSVYIVGTPSRLNMAVSHEDDKRRTSLREKLYNCLSDQDEFVKLCQERIQASLSGCSNPSTRNSETSPKEKSIVDQPLFDSDDSWVKDIDNSTYGLELDDFETLFPTQTTETSVLAIGKDKTTPVKFLSTENGLEMDNYEILFSSQEDDFSESILRNDGTKTHHMSGDHIDFPEVNTVTLVGHKVDARKTKPVNMVSPMCARVDMKETKAVNMVTPVSDEVHFSESKSIKRQASTGGSQEMQISPTKTLKTQTPVTPVRNIFRGLNLDHISPDKK